MTEETKQRNTGAMVALFIPPDVAQRIYDQVAPTLLAMGIQPEPVVDLHITLVYLGDADGLDRQRLSDVLEPFLDYPLFGEINGVGRFLTGGSEGTNALYLTLDSLELSGFRYELLESLQEVGFGLGQDHGFIPHITIGYLPDGMPTPDVRVAPLMVMFHDYTLAIGDDRLQFSIYDVPEMMEPAFVINELESDERAAKGGKERGLKATIRKVFDMLRKHPEPTGFKVLPDGRWAAWYTNSFEDKEDEYFPELAIDQFVSRVDNKQVDYPDLWFYHIPGTRHGVAEWVGRVDHIVLAVGSFDENETGNAFKESYRKYKGKFKVSHGFWFNPAMKKDGAYWEFDTFEISPLPMGKEANAVTTFVTLEGIKEMPISDEKKNTLAALIGDDLAAKLLANTEKESKDLETKGVKFKEATPPPVTTADEAARGAIKELAEAQAGSNTQSAEGIKALGTKLDTLIAALEGVKGLEAGIAGVVTDVKALKEADASRETRLQGLETLVKEAFDLSPAASKSSQTTMPLNDQYLQWLKTQNTDTKAEAPEGIFGLMLAGLKEGKKE